MNIKWITLLVQRSSYLLVQQFQQTAANKRAQHTRNADTAGTQNEKKVCGELVQAACSEVQGPYKQNENSSTKRDRELSSTKPSMIRTAATVKRSTALNADLA
eukprot:scpid104150/ scgid30161/ 